MRQWINLVEAAAQDQFLAQPFIKDWDRWAKEHGATVSRDAAQQSNWIAPNWRATLSGDGGGLYDPDIGGAERASAGAITINHIEVPENRRGEGLGRQLMQALCAIADKHHVKLILQADESNDDESWDDEEEEADYDEREHWLQTWYSSLGFDYNGYWGDYGPYMERQPRA